MIKIEHTITNPLKNLGGITSRLLEVVSQNFKSTIEILFNEKVADAKRAVTVMKMGIKHGDKFEVDIYGDDEEEASSAIEKFIRERL